MSETDENKKIQKITKLLERGGTMLANHHECGAPLFRYQGKILCPVCDFQESEITKKMVEQKGQKEIRLEIGHVKKPEEEYNQIAVLTLSKIHNIATSLENETDLQRVKEKMECIELGIKILKLLE